MQFFFEWHWLGACYLALVAVPLAVIDWQSHRLPNKLVLPSFAVTGLGFLAALTQGFAMALVLQALLLSVATFVFGLIANRFASLGMGDVKLLAAISLAFGWQSTMVIIWVIAIAMTLAAFYILTKFFSGAIKMGQSIALGPFLLLALVIVQGWSLTAHQVPYLAAPW
ncbi:prepilin peptidase [Candidatus Rhodoluna planktonica]|uniref:Prepilin type IV endopeptidase peptidase domain-containing protein n=1 Tax=Candidatus Rhodoluna planktonica TaxID=535712 RepID=A0A1D9DYA6_9MICO|nr:prepilin peptidase [Candidatus Rhodoluna planktonica]AOY55782.1 hypothetical protein A4Z71_01935 [Candidatus Rhodoluna planktonica]